MNRTMHAMGDPPEGQPEDAPADAPEADLEDAPADEPAADEGEPDSDLEEAPPVAEPEGKPMQQETDPPAE